jgi:hypothetical protein
MNTIENKGQKDIILLDFSKAFDKVPHDLLLLKLKRFCLHPNILGWIAKKNLNRSQEVIVQSIPETSASYIRCAAR